MHVLKETGREKLGEKQDRELINFECEGCQRYGKVVHVRQGDPVTEQELADLVAAMGDRDPCEPRPRVYIAAPGPHTILLVHGPDIANMDRYYRQVEPGVAPSTPYLKLECETCGQKVYCHYMAATPEENRTRNSGSMLDHFQRSVRAFNKELPECKPVAP
jgi:hypothetical protein